LKRAALYWAQIQGYTIAALEVRTPNSNYRADVAAYRPERVRLPSPGLTAVFECKQARPDYLKDGQALQKSIDRLKELNERREKLERQLGLHCPTLRAGDALFQEYQSVDLSTLAHEGYRKLRRELEQVERRIYGKTKFDRMVRWGCANLLYVVAPEGLIRPEELPVSWGLLVSPEKEGDGIAPLELVKKPHLVDVPAERRLDFLQRIAGAGTRKFNQDAGIVFEDVWEARRRG